WAIGCPGMSGLAGLEAARDQLWAEAVHRFKAGARWHLETPELEALATAEQAARFAVDVWEESVSDYLGDRDDTSLSELLEALGFAQTQSAQKRVVAILA